MSLFTGALGATLARPAEEAFLAVAYPDADPGLIREELRRVVVRSRDRGLYHGAKWAADAVNALVSSSTAKRSREPVQWRDEEEDELEVDLYRAAKCSFDLREFSRAAAELEGCTGPKAVFLRYYSKYLVGEQRKEEAMREVLGRSENHRAFNKELDEILIDLKRYQESGMADTFIYYLIGVVHRHKKQINEATSTLVRAVQEDQYNWSAWKELSVCVRSVQELRQLRESLPPGFMKDFFILHTLLALQDWNHQLLLLAEKLECLFPNSSFLAREKARVYYNGRDYVEATQIFEANFARDTHNVDHWDLYSNILYVNGDRSKLGRLAKAAVSISKYKVETCCVVGNYYGSRHEHEKAVMQFKRALKLNRNFTSAWTLLGHELMELKNVYGAIEAYRRAVDVDERDYRAWFSLGQSYEMLNMPNYAMYYYQKAIALRPRDTRIWNVMGAMCSKQGRTDDAIKCHQHALASGEQDMETCKTLGDIFHREGKDDQAAAYYEKMWEAHKKGPEGVELPNNSGACLRFLANYKYERQEYNEAYEYAKGTMKELVKEMAQHCIDETAITDVNRLLERIAQHVPDSIGGNHHETSDM